MYTHKTLTRQAVRVKTATTGGDTAMRELTCSAAIKEAMCEEMRQNDAVYLIGEDMGVYGGKFGVTAGMLEEFGRERVMDTPISETAAVGAAIGSAATGMRPIIEIMFSDFFAVCFDQILNQAAKMRYMFGGQVKVPLVVRMPSGGGTGAAAQHSQSLEAMFCHIPGVKVVMPSNPYDAKGLLKAAIRDDNCVIFFEPKLLYKHKGPVPQEDYVLPIGKADIKREGSDLSIITYGRTVPMALDVADKLKAEGKHIEVLDLRTLLPMDKDAVIATAKKTGRVVIAHEAVEFAGFGGEIAATIAESDALGALRTPIKRVGALFAPVPFNKSLEQAVLPDAVRIEQAVREIL